MNYKVDIVVPFQTIANMFCGALEGGCNYWLSRCDLLKSDTTPKPRLVWWGTEEIFAGDYIAEVKHDAAQRKVQTTTRIDRPKVERGLKVMAEKYPGHFGDMLSETQGDATTADVFMQCVVLGDVVFG